MFYVRTIRGFFITLTNYLTKKLAFHFSFTLSNYPNDPDLTELDEGADIVVHLWFKNFQFVYEEEYTVCDWTCLIGEFGGNWGFFLGGSILAGFDLATFVLMSVVRIK